MFTADQIVCHFVGDYLFQSHWMATEKTKRSVAAAAHALTYTLPFLFLTRSWAALVMIAGTHFVIDRWRLARYIVWLKNFLGPVAWAENKGPDPDPKTIDMVFEAPPGYWGGEYPLLCSVNRPWSECSATGYAPDVPPWLSVWLLIIADNVLHVCCNAVALRWL